MENILETNALTKHYKSFKALNGLTMHIPKGSVYGLVGRNGAGKTTLIRLICGLQEPSDGEYTLYGIKNNDRRICDSRRKIGAVVEAPAVYPEMNARENLNQQILLLGKSNVDVTELLETVGLADTGRKKVKDFSLGMRQRLGIAIALAGNPDFLILDEPTNGLDPQGIVEIRELILKLNRERGITVLISSHILDELSRLATHYGFVDSGRTVSEMSAEELEQRCRKSTLIQVSDVGALNEALDAMGIEYKAVDEHSAYIYSDVQVTELVNKLSEKRCTVYSMKENDESLESFYMNLVGGARNA